MHVRFSVKIFFLRKNVHLRAGYVEQQHILFRKFWPVCSERWWKYGFILEHSMAVARSAKNRIYISICLEHLIRPLMYLYLVTLLKLLPCLT